MTPDNLKAFAEGRKTQTRRLSGLKEINKEPDKWRFMPILTDSWIPSLFVFFCDNDFDKSVDVKPHYRPGEVVYLPETWRVGAWDENGGKIAVDYKLGNFSREEWLQIPNDDDGEKFDNLWIECSEEAEIADAVYDSEGQYHWKPGESPCRWRSPRFMPEWASRYHARIISVLPERLQEIIEMDAIAEGCLSRSAFISLWNSINKKQLWDTNPWILCYQIAPLEKECCYDKENS